MFELTDFNMPIWFRKLFRKRIISKMKRDLDIESKVLDMIKEKENNLLKDGTLLLPYFKEYVIYTIHHFLLIKEKTKVEIDIITHFEQFLNYITNVRLPKENNCIGEATEKVTLDEFMFCYNQYLFQVRINPEHHTATAGTEYNDAHFKLFNDCKARFFRGYGAIFKTADNAWFFGTFCGIQLNYY